MIPYSRNTRLLSPKGWLFVGPSETGLLLSHSFVSAKVPLAFAFRPLGAVPVEARPVNPDVPRRPPPTPRPMTPPHEMPFSSVRLTAAPLATVPAPTGLESGRVIEYRFTRGSPGVQASTAILAPGSALCLEAAYEPTSLTLCAAIQGG